MANFITDMIEPIKDIIFDAPDKKEIEIDADGQITDSDRDLNKKIELRIIEAEQIRKPKLTRWEKYLRFFDGDHWQVAGIVLPQFKADIVINKVFAAFRSLVAFETDAKPQPVAEARITESTPLEKREPIIASTKKIESMLDHKWDYRQIPNMLTEIFYDRYIFDDGYGQYFWNAVDDDVDFELIKPHEILRSPGATSIDDAEYIIVEKWRNRKFIEENYPDKVEEIRFTNTKDLNPQNPFAEGSERDNIVKVHYYYQDNIWVIKAGNVILERKRNPHWEWRSPEEQAQDIKSRVGDLPPGWQPVKNHLRKPEKPVIQFKGYHLGGEFESRSLMKQIIDLNMAINKRKCQWQDILDGTGSPQWVIDPSVSRDDAERITSKPGLKIRINPTLIRKEPAAQPPNGSFEDMIHTERSFDDITGIHEISRGSSPKKRITKGEAELLKESDIVPIRLLMRNSESALIKLINGWVQLMKLYYDQPHYIGKMGDEEAQRYGEFLVREEIPDSLLLTIKVGSTMPVSKEMRRAEMRADFQMGALSLIDYLKAMDYPNPEKLAENVAKQQQAMQQAPQQ